MKKAYELSTLTGTQVLLLVVSETGLVYTFTTAKLQPLVTQPEGKNLIQACLNAPHGTLPNTMPVGPPMGRSAPMSGVPTHHNNVPGGLAIGGDKVDEGGEQDEENERAGSKRRRRASTSGAQAPGAASRGPAVIQTPVAATPPLLRTALHRRYRRPSPSLLTPKVHTLLTRAHPISRCSDRRRLPHHPCNSPRHLITRTQVQRSSTTRARTALPVMTSMLHSRD